MNRIFVCIFIAAMTAVSLTGCSSVQVDRVDVEETVDLSGHWNDTDSRLVAQAVISDALRGLWLNQFQSQHDRRPVIIVGEILNRSQEHINAQVFIKDLERALLNSGEVRFVVSADERAQPRDERAQQHAGQTRPSTIKELGDELGADFILTGTINTIKDQHERRYVILYQVNLELIDIQTNEKIWIGQHAIKKVVDRKPYSL